MSDYTSKVKDFFAKHKNNDEAIPMAKYMKNKFPFLGIAAPRRKELTKVFFNTYPTPPYDEAKAIVRELFNLPEREYHYFAISLLTRYKKKWSPTDIVYFESLLLNKSWWDSVDLINSKIIAEFFIRYPNLAIPMTDSWSESKNIWLKRISIIFQLSYNENTNTQILEKHIYENIDNNEFFIQKAIGWALREYSKSNYKWVLHFVIQNTKLKPLSKREAIKWIDTKGLIK